MQVNFTGIKNASSMMVMTDQPKMYAIVLNAQLTDDFNGKELSDFKEISRKTGGNSSYQNPVNSNFINIIGKRELVEDNINSTIILNDTPLPAQRDTLSMYTFLAKLTRMIAAKSDESFVVNRDYIGSDDFKDGVLLGNNLDTLFGDSVEEVSRSIIQPKLVKVSAAGVNQCIQDIMLDYLA